MLEGAVKTVLGQSRPAGTSAVSLYTVASKVQAELLCLFIANTTGSAATYSVYVHNTGTTWDQTTAIAYDLPIPANSTATVNFSDGGGFPLIVSGGSIGIKTGTGNALTFTLIGNERKV